VSTFKKSLTSRDASKQGSEIKTELVSKRALCKKLYIYSKMEDSFEGAFDPSFSLRITMAASICGKQT